LIKAPLKKKQSDIKERGINAKKKINNIHWFKGEILKKKYTKELKTETQNQKKDEQIWNQNKIRREITFQC